MNLSGQGLDPFHGRHDISQADSELVVDDNHLAPCDQLVVDQNFQRLAHHFGQLDYRALPQLQQIINQHFGAPQFHRNSQGNIENLIQVLGFLIG